MPGANDPSDPGGPPAAAAEAPASALAGLLRRRPVRSAVEGLVWPALPGSHANAILGLLGRLEESQWWPAERLRQAQLDQLGSLLAHCHAQVPYYRKQLEAAGYRPGEPVTEALWQRLPPLERPALQREPERLRARHYPKAHGRTLTKSTSGSSGRPVQVRATMLTELFWDTLSLRFLIWAGFDPRGKMAAIRGRLKKAVYPEGLRQANWGPPLNQLFETGPAVALSGLTPMPQQIEWLVRQDPDYLVTVAHSLTALARLCRRTGTRVPNLKAVQTFGGVVTKADREACREAWGAALFDTYSTEEVGYIALQCPDHEHLHVQAESVLMEILDAEGRPCRPGELGRVVVTPLHSFAMPLLRYDIGDLAIAGAPCACGRGLPVVAEVAGRSRDMLTLPDGSQASPGFMAGLFGELPVAQYQLVQDAPDRLEARIVPAEGFAPEDEARIAEALHERLPAPYRVSVRQVENIERTPGGKYLDFKSKIADDG